MLRRFLIASELSPGEPVKPSQKLVSKVPFLLFRLLVLPTKITRLENLAGTNTLAYQRAYCYKTFYAREFCPWQAFPAKSNVCGWTQEPTLEDNTRKGVTLG